MTVTVPARDACDVFLLAQSVSDRVRKFGAIYGIRRMHTRNVLMT